MPIASVHLVVPALAALVLVGCGADGGSPSGASSSASPSPSGTPSETVLADITGDSPFYLDEVSVRVAESFPVQLFLDVSGSVPTPCHVVAYTVQTGPDGIAVTITSQSSVQTCVQMLDSRRLVIPLGPSELPVTVDVNDGEYIETVRP